MANSDNPATGAEFERHVQSFFERRGLHLTKNVAVPVGIGHTKARHKFDLVSLAPPVLVECKCHAWTASGNSPSAKLTAWNEAMLYFLCAPKRYRKLLVVLRSLHEGQSLAEHYLRRYRHLIPRDVEVWDFDPATGQGRLLHGQHVD